MRTRTALAFLVTMLPASAVAADLVLVSITGPSRVITDTDIDLEVTVRNDGTATGDDLDIVLRASSDADYDPVTDTELCATTVVGGLGAGASANRAVRCRWPAAESGPYIVGRVSAPVTTVDTSPLNNANSLGPLTVVPASSPNLQITFDPAPTRLTAGRAQDLPILVENTGLSPVGSLPVAIWLSSDAVLDGADTPLCRPTFGAIAASSSERQVVSCAVGGGLPGTRWLFAVADPDDDVLEIAEDDNVVSAEVDFRPPPPEMELVSLSAPGSVEQGETIDVDYTIRNNGSDGAPGTNLEIRISGDTVFDGSDPLICSQGMPVPNPLASSSGTVTGCTVPAATPAGARYLVGRVDAQALFDEVDEVDNDYALAIDVLPDLPDLVVHAMSVPAQIEIGIDTTLEVTVRNAGIADATSAVAIFRISQDDVYEGSDPELCTVGIPAVAEGALRVVSSDTCVVPAGVSLGGAHVVVRVDAGNLVDEIDDANNDGSEAVTIVPDPRQPDLEIDALRAPTSALAGGSIAVEVDVENTGDAPSPSTNVVVALSSDAIPDVLDTPLCAESVPAIGVAVGSPSVVQLQCTVPSGTSAGPWFLIARVDPTDTVEESDESDNFAGRPFDIEAPGPTDTDTDLVPTDTDTDGLVGTDTDTDGFGWGTDTDTDTDAVGTDTEVLWPTDTDPVGATDTLVVDSPVDTDTDKPLDGELAPRWFCGTAPAGGWWLGMLAGLAMLGRRRRRV